MTTPIASLTPFPSNRIVNPQFTGPSDAFTLGKRVVITSGKTDHVGYIRSACVAPGFLSVDVQCDDGITRGVCIDRPVLLRSTDG